MFKVNNSQKMVLVIGSIFFFVIIVGVIASFGKAVPERVGQLYPLESDQYISTGRLKSYISPESPEPTAERIKGKLGRPTQMSDLNQWRQDQTRPILLTYDDYAISVQGIDGNRSRVEVTNHETAYNRHHSHFIYFFGGPTIRRGSLPNWGGTTKWGGPGRVQDGGIGGIGGK